MTEKKKTGRPKIDRTIVNEPVRTFRVVCHGHGLPGHHDHIFNYNTRDQAELMQRRRTAEWARNPKTEKCTPFHLESQLISAWQKEEPREEASG